MGSSDIFHSSFTSQEGEKKSNESKSSSMTDSTVTPRPVPSTTVKLATGPSTLRRLNEINSNDSVVSFVSGTSRNRVFTGSAMERDGRSQTIQVGRIIFILYLFLLGIIAVHFVTRLMHRSEDRLGSMQFEKIALYALPEAQRRVDMKRRAALTMANVIAVQLPNSSAWPFVTVSGFQSIAETLQAPAGNDMILFAPLLDIEQMTEFEDFIYDYYLNQRVPPLPMESVEFSFGRGVWRIDETKVDNNETKVDNRVHDYDEITFSRSPLNISAPIVHATDAYNIVVPRLYNLHSDPEYSEAIEDVVSCVAENPKGMVCGRMSQFHEQEFAGLVSCYLEPVFPSSDPEFLTGIVGTTMNWKDLFFDLFDPNVFGIHCVVTSEDGGAFTFYIEHGTVVSSTPGDVHHRDFDAFGEHIELIPTSKTSYASTGYTLSVYPTAVFDDLYHSRKKLVTSIVTAMILLATTVLFLLYDYFVRKEFQERKEMLDAKRKFMRYVSHEVRTPLNAVIMGLNVVTDEIMNVLNYHRSTIAETEDTDTDDDHRQYDSMSSECLSLLHDIQASANSAVEVLNDVLNYDKIERSSLQLELTMIPIWQLIEKTLSEFKIPAARKQVYLRILYEEARAKQVPTDASASSLLKFPSEKQQPMPTAKDLPEEMKNLRLAGDESRMAQVLRNLLSNAIKFTPALGTVVARTTYIENTGRQSTDSITLKDNTQISATRKGNIRFTVEDTGAGMTEAQLEKLFGEGVQFNVNELQAGKGSGLGLFITKGLVAQHHGTLVASSEGLGRGATFTLEFPLYEVPGMTATDDSTTQAKTGTCPSLRLETGAANLSEPDKLKLLVVDDVASNRKLLSRLLTKKNHDCDMAENGEIAVSMVKTAIENGHNYDCVLMDYEMPVMNGPTAAKEIRDLGSDVFIVGVTGNMLNEDVEFFMANGANVVLPKPIQIPVLEEVWVEHSIGTYFLD